MTAKLNNVKRQTPFLCIRALHLRDSQRLQVLSWDCSQLKAPQESICFQSHSCDCLQDSVSHRLLDGVPQILDSSFQRPPLVPRHVGLSLGQLTEWQLASSEWAEAKEVSEKEASLYDLSWALTARYFCCVLFIAVICTWEASHTPATLGGGLHQTEPQEARVTDSHLKSC